MNKPNTATLNWLEANRRHLMAAINAVRRTIEAYLAQGSSQPEQTRASDELAPQPAHTLNQAGDLLPAIDRLTNVFNLTAFERRVLLMCAGMELDASFARQVYESYGHPNFSLALAALEEAHWSALSPGRPLRYWRLLEIKDENSLTLSKIRIDERTLHFLTGLQHLDERLAGFIRPLDLESLNPAETLVPSQLDLAGQLVDLWSSSKPTKQLPILQITGLDAVNRRAIAAAACLMSGIPAHLLPVSAFPTDSREQEALQRLWEREAAFSSSALLIEDDLEAFSNSEQHKKLARWIEGLRAPMMVLSKEQLPLPHRKTVSLHANKPTSEEQKVLWRRALKQVGGEDQLHNNSSLERLSAQFNLNATQIQAASQVALSPGKPNDDPEQAAHALWQACRSQAQPQLGNLAQRLEPVATWEDIVLPDSQQQILQEIAIHVRQRNRVYESWGFAAQSGRGLGISALFTGPSGTGKTMAAEVLANALELDLYRIDLSSVVSKYIGETEKNLRQVFDAAEDGGAILLFDEADALFGKRSEIKDSHDRYANIEVSYLLQRMEAYRGLAILTTNLKGALDQAFLRRIRFVVQFPFPDARLRAAIWRQIFPPDTPTTGLEPEKLARLDITGGNIRNIALYAAFLAADQGQAVQMQHILRAARVEYVKLEKSLSSSAIEDWTVSHAAA